MGTVISRRRKDGSASHQAQVYIKRAGVIVHREVRTFDRKQAASAWLEKRERELAKPGALERLAAPEPTLADAIDRYTEESLKQIGKTKAQVLRAIKTQDIAQKACSQITSVDLVDLAKTLAETIQPQTVGNYMSHLSSIFTIAKPAWKYPLDEGEMKSALIVAKKLGLISKSRQRERRPTLDELDKLMTHFGNILIRRPSSLPMQRIVAFAIFSTRRQEEIVTVRRPDLEAEASRILVRDMKNPGDKIGNNIWTDLPPEALKIIEAMPDVADEIFPYTADAISAAFTRACKFLGIEDLHFHDLRHEGISRLFEMGGSIPSVAAISGHRTWTSLQRYTHLRQTGDKYAGWKWLDVVTAPLAPPKRRRSLRRCKSRAAPHPMQKLIPVLSIKKGQEIC